MQPGAVPILVLGLIHHDPGQGCSALESLAVRSRPWRGEVQVLYVEMDEPNPSDGVSVGMWVSHCLQKGLTRQGERQGDFSSDVSASEIKSLAGACSDAL